MLQLYYAPHTCALASHIALEEAGAQYATVRMSFQSEDQKKPGYMKINPNARVPSLVTDKGIHTETPAILAFIAQTYPVSKLAPVKCRHCSNEPSRKTMVLSSSSRAYGSLSPARCSFLPQSPAPRLFLLNTPSW